MNKSNKLLNILESKDEEALIMIISAQTKVPMVNFDTSINKLGVIEVWDKSSVGREVLAWVHPSEKKFWVTPGAALGKRHTDAITKSIKRKWNIK